jgi:hypothetical protein
LVSTRMAQFSYSILSPRKTAYVLGQRELGSLCFEKFAMGCFRLNAYH